MNSQAKTAIMIILLVSFVVTVGYVFGKVSGNGNSFVIPALLFSLMASFVSYYFSDRMVLAISGAKHLKPGDDPKLYEVISEVVKEAGIPQPEVYFIDDSSPNAFATGRDPGHAAICITAGLREKLNRAEMKGVISHELSHIRNYDTLLMTLTAVSVGFISLLADWFMRSLWFRDNDDRQEGFLIVLGLVLAVFSPIIATIIQLAISRRREFVADATGAQLTSDPEALACALEKIAADRTVPKFANNATAHLFIINPFKGKAAASFLAGLFNTHPPIDLRIRILRSM